MAKPPRLRPVRIRGVDLGVVVHVLALEAEQLQEVALVAGVVGDLEQVLGGDLRPQVAAGLLHVVAQLAVVQAQAVGLVGRRRVVAVQVLAEGALQLLDRALVQALVLHDPVDDGDVQRHHRDRGAGLGDHRLEHGHVGRTARRLQPGVDGVGGAVQVLLGLAQGAMPVDRPGDLGADVAEGHGLGVRRQHAGLGQGVDPQLPVLATHHLHGVGDFLLGGRLDRGLDHLVAVGVHRGGLVRLADRLERRALELAGIRQAAHGRGQRVHDQVDRAAHLADQLDGLGADLVGEGVAVDRAAPQAGGLGLAVELGGVVPARVARLLLGAGLLEEHAQGGGAVAEGGGDTRG